MHPDLGGSQFLRHGILDLKLLLFDAVYQIIVWEGPGFFGFELGFEFCMFQAQGRQMIFAHRYLLLACRQESRSSSTHQSQGGE
jgi:hypothetical protein